MKTELKLAALLAAAIFLHGCAGGGSNGSVEYTSTPSRNAGQSSGGSSQCGTVNGQPVQCQPYLPFGGHTPTPGIPLFKSWTETMYGNYMALSSNAASVVLGPGLAPVPGGDEMSDYSLATFRIASDGTSHVEFLSASGYSWPAILAFRAPLHTLASIDQPGLDTGSSYGYATMQSPFLSITEQNLGMLANPLTLGWEYQSFGAWDQIFGGDTVAMVAASFGAPTLASAVPGSGVATFTGVIGSLYVSPDGVGSGAVANLTVGADFSTRTLTFSSSNTVLTRDLSTATPAPHLDLNGTLAYAPASNTFSGTLANAGGTMSGPTKGQFYGPAAQELGGAFKLKSAGTVETMVGAYGAKR